MAWVLAIDCLLYLTVLNSFHNTANRQSIKKQEEVHTEDDEKISYVKL